MSQLGVVYLDERGEEATCRNWQPTGIIRLVETESSALRHGSTSSHLSSRRYFVLFGHRRTGA